MCALVTLMVKGEEGTGIHTHLDKKIHTVWEQGGAGTSEAWAYFTFFFFF